ncbi:MAG: prephenate dehydrogenase [Candidatus Altiarchaeota archaeon]
MNCKSRAAVVGGYGGMGRVFASLLKSEGFDVVVSGPTESKGRRASGELGVEYVSDNVSAVSGADVVVVSVPIDETVRVIEEVGPKVGKGALIMDVTSIKKVPCDAMAKNCGKGVEILGTHPIFGPRVGKIDGQVFVLTPVREGKWTKKIRAMLAKHKARVHESTPEKHDKVMAVVQGLTHFTYISLGKTLEELGFDIKESRNYSSPIYEMMLDMVGRIIGQDPKLYAEIQMRNTEIPGVHKAFLKTATELAQVIEQGDEKAFIKVMAEAAKNFDDVDRAMGRSDKAISSLVAELELLKDSVGKELCLAHIYSGMRHVGVVEDVSPDEVVISEGGRRKSLKLSNIRVLGNAERIAFKKEKYGTVARDFSIVVNSCADESFIASILEEHDDGIVGVEVKDVYEGPQVGEGSKSVCFSVEFINSGVKESERGVSEFFEKIGGKRR